MTSRCSLAEFKSAGLTPQECDSGPYGDSPDTYWFACDYHEGYIDGYEAAKEQG